MNKLLTEAQEIISQKYTEMTEDLALKYFPIQQKIYQAEKTKENQNFLMKNKFGLDPIKISYETIQRFDGLCYTLETQNKKVYGPLKTPILVEDYPVKIPAQYLKKSSELLEYFGNKVKIYVADFLKMPDPYIFCQISEDKEQTYLIGVWD